MILTACCGLCHYVWSGQTNRKNAKHMKTMIIIGILCFSQNENNNIDDLRTFVESSRLSLMLHKYHLYKSEANKEQRK